MKQISDLKALALKHAGSSAIPDLEIHKLDQPTELIPLIYEPSVCLILQGEKRTIIGEKVLDYSGGSCLMIAAELSALGQVTRASVSEPFLALALTINTTKLADAMRKAPISEHSGDQSFGLQSASELLIETWGRLLGMLDRPDEIQALGPLYEQELLYRFLVGPMGPFLRQIGTADSDLSRIRQTMEFIRQHHAERLEVRELAELAGMSLTTFHRRFKKVAGISPLQYQKQFRLHEAKRYLVAREGNAASVAYRVGYESTSQFSREYRRLFGLPPLQDAAAARELAKVRASQ
ncbi:AraC family transcriptional regulator [Roseibium sp. RKSG952]|uniref:AraC family transcriptional regulator n=1 Tax=Roseibium sp. RKSG952 TaxID=2529384 RepID=UPI0012BD16FE|nr:AraC family transcriptional regulator [Roseibium sp. RKSG952]MTI02093.1 AraC family transcriptional regulator [Roseibium sp. RKSG952]